MSANFLKFYSPKIFSALALTTTLLTLIVIGLGAYTRLTDAGLGCPDWPGCYGQWFLDPKTITTHLFNPKKAWTEMIHRYMAGLLGILIFVLALPAIKYAGKSKKSLFLPIALITLIIFQALLGRWTVTLKLLPIVVMAHLLGGMTTLVLLWWFTLKRFPKLNNPFAIDQLKKLRRIALFALTALSLQILLGGWTSANYAALVCLDFPFCQMPADFHFDFLEAFRFSAGVGNIGEALNHHARITIQLLHRMGALLTTVSIAWFAWLAWRHGKKNRIRMLSFLTFSLLTVQVLLGISNVLLLLPVTIAVAHNCIAALLLLSLITLVYYLHPAFSQSKDQHA
jgi:cytochrome c oxidase assembly protein subunit 15